MDQLTSREQFSSAYASGALDPAFRLLADAQAALRAEQQAAITAADALAGALFEGETPAAMSPGALAAVMGRLDAEEQASPQQRAARAAGALIDEILALPEPVHAVALDAIAHGGWTFAGPGLRVLPLALEGEAKAEIIRIEPGWGAPRHTHRGAEYTLVLCGAFSDARGQYRAGDIAVAGPDITHSPTALKGEVCYALAVTEAPLEFTGALALLHRLWRH